MKITNESMGDLEILLHAILNGGIEVGTVLRENCDDYYPSDNQELDIVEEIDRLYEIVKNHNEYVEADF